MERSEIRDFQRVGWAKRSVPTQFAFARKAAWARREERFCPPYARSLRIAQRWLAFKSEFTSAKILFNVFEREPAALKRLSDRTGGI